MVQPDFWLQVKNEYVEENFEQLLHYLHYFNLNLSPDDLSFKTSSEALHNVADKYLSLIDKGNICVDVLQRWEDPDKVIRMIAAHLLTSHKRGINDTNTLARLAHALILIEHNDKVVVRLQEIVVNCMVNKRIGDYNFTWTNLEPETWYRQQFVQMLCGTTFDNDADNNIYFYEKNGLVIYDCNKLNLSHINKSQYQKQNQQNKWSVCPTIQITGDKKHISADYDNIKDAIESRKFLASACSNFSPSPKTVIKEYQPDSWITVQIVDKTSFNMTLETIQPEYEKIRCTIGFDHQQYKFTRDFFFNAFEKGEQITVLYTGNQEDPFDLDGSFAQNYQDLAEDSKQTRTYAVYDSNYAVGNGFVGTRWITEKGIIVSIKDPITDDAQNAIDNHLPLKIEVAESRMSNDKFVTNGHFLQEYDSEVKQFDPNFVEKAHKSLIRDFVNQTETIEVKQSDIKKDMAIDAQYITMLSHAIYYSSAHATTTLERYAHITAAQMLATMANNTFDKLVIEHEASYLENLIKFAQNEDNGFLSLTHPAELDGLGFVTQKESIIDKLTQYKQSTPETMLAMSFENDLDVVSDLVDASNTLQSKNISMHELNRIKKTIATKLKVDDMFVTPNDKHTYYGEESDTLEFKSSIVFPPKNIAIPEGFQPHDVQIWEILKPICGFLNSTSGGELLIGVTDDGYPKSLNDDLDYLFSQHLISEKTMDKLRLYLMYKLDKAFCDDTGSIKGNDITATRINYLIENNDDGISILRVQVKPYEYGTVKFIDRPQFVARSYVRKSGSTIKMSDEIKREIFEKKVNTPNGTENEKIIRLQQAIKENKTVILKQYSSSRGTRDRRVEPYELRLNRNAVICVDVTEAKKAKVKEFLISRCGEIIVQNNKWTNFKKHKHNLEIDIFGFLADANTSDKTFDIEMKMTDYAANLLKEKYLTMEQYECIKRDKNATDFPCTLSVTVFNLAGPAQFFIGLAEHIRIVKGDKLKEYIKDYVNSNLTDI